MAEFPQLTDAKFSFMQDGNTDGTTGDIEDITFEIETVPGMDTDEEGFYYVIRTGGWSFTDLDELSNLVNKVKNMVMAAGDKK